MVTAICNECGRVFDAAVILGLIDCPECGSKNVSVATPRPDDGEDTTD